MADSLNGAWVDRHLQFQPVNAVASSSFNSEKVRIVSWDILANQYSRGQRNRPYHVLAESYRNPLWRKVLRRFMDLEVDFICLQEVDVKVALQTLKESYTRLLTPTGHGHGDGRVDACCIFYRTEKWTLFKMQIVDMDDLANMFSCGESDKEDALRMLFRHAEQYDSYQAALRQNNYGILAKKFKHRNSGKQLVIANTHLYWNPEFEYVKLCQAHYLVSQMKEFCATDKDVPVVLCGDLNSQPGSLVYRYLTEGGEHTVDVTCPRLKGVLLVEEWLKEYSFLACPVHLESSYAHPSEDGQEISPFTNITSDFVGFLDYIFYHPKCMVPVKRLYLPRSLNEIAKESSGCYLIPNEFWPSDHLAVGVELAFN